MPTQRPKSYSGRRLTTIPRNKIEGKKRKTFLPKPDPFVFFYTYRERRIKERWIGFLWPFFSRPRGHLFLMFLYVHCVGVNHSGGEGGKRRCWHSSSFRKALAPLT
ncbi:hypothetical protein CDAR_116321 [Caerostris darwini]|uniref:Uncharacterized protein n=1 Tax=Caerostris darwini TaxID=1538125 RepID=A0AAV4WM33_9ARAC|nr:hypothetical protein CDAR_116321 [Caerostris darwini]